MDLYGTSQLPGPLETLPAAEEALLEYGGCTSFFQRKKQLLPGKGTYLRSQSQAVVAPEKWE